MRVKGLLTISLLVALLLLASCAFFQAPILTIGLTPTAGAVNAIVSIAGAGFGATQGTSVVTFD